MSVTRATGAPAHPARILAPELSFTAAKWARSIWCAVSLALAGCATTPPPAPAPPPPAPATSEPPRKREASVMWEGGDATTMGCPLTETNVEVPDRWRPDLQRISETEVVLPPTDDRRGAILVRAADHPLTTGEALDDIRRLFELIDVPVPKEMPPDSIDYLNEEVLPDLDYIDVNMQPAVEIEPEPPRTETLIVGYHLVKRNGAMCRFAMVAPASDPGEYALRVFLGEVYTPNHDDSPDWTYPPATQKEPPPPICKGWPVWMFPSCRPASLPPAQAKKKR